MTKTPKALKAAPREPCRHDAAYVAHMLCYSPFDVFPSRTKLEMREEHGLRPDSLDGLVAGCIQTSRGWRLAPRSLLGEGPRWIFP